MNTATAIGLSKWLPLQKDQRKDTEKVLVRIPCISRNFFFVVCHPGITCTRHSGTYFRTFQRVEPVFQHCITDIGRMSTLIVCHFSGFHHQCTHPVRLRINRSQPHIIHNSYYHCHNDRNPCSYNIERAEKRILLH